MQQSDCVQPNRKSQETSDGVHPSGQDRSIVQRCLRIANEIVSQRTIGQLWGSLKEPQKIFEVPTEVLSITQSHLAVAA